MRLDGELDVVPYWAQPRVWVLVPILLASGVAIFAGYHHRRFAMRITLVEFFVVALLSYMLVSSAWAIDPELAATKAYEVALLLAMVVALSITKQITGVVAVADGFWLGLFALGLAMGLAALWFSTAGRVFTPGGGPNTFGRNMGLMAIGAVYLTSRYPRLDLLKPTAVATCLLAVLLILMCGSRGGLLSSAMAGITYLAFANMGLPRKVVLIGSLVVVGTATLMMTSAGHKAYAVFESRIIETTLENRHLSERDSLWTDAIAMTKQHPVWGAGLNSYRASSWTYPHNFVLEMAAEGGGIAIGLFLLAIFTWLAQLRHTWRGVPRESLAGWVLLFTAAQTSGDIYDSRGVFILLTLTAAPAMQSAVSAVSVAPQRRSQLSRSTSLPLSAS